MKRLLSDNAGISLIEVTFAMGILATALSLLFGSLISITVISRVNEEKAVANHELASILEQLRGLPLADLMEFAPETPSHPGVERAVLLECYDTEGAAVALPLALATDEVTGEVTGQMPDLPNPLEVKATLLWTNDRGHVFQSRVTTMVSR